MQANHQGPDRLAKRRAWLKPVRCWRHGALAAAGAASTEQPHPRHVGPYRWQLDAVVDHLRVIEIDPACGTRLRVDVFVNERALRRVLTVLRAAS